MTLHDAVIALNPTIAYVQGDTAYDANGAVVTYDKAAAAEYAKTGEYKTLRALEYPSIAEQLDDLFHAGAFSSEMTARIRAIKDKYPKG